MGRGCGGGEGFEMGLEICVLEAEGRGGGVEERKSMFKSFGVYFY